MERFFLLGTGWLRAGDSQFPAHVASVLVFLLLVTTPPLQAKAENPTLDILPLRPFSFDVSFNQRTFAPERRVIAIQAGFTALHYGSLEVRAIYQYYSHHTPTFVTDQNSFYVNPRWNNFIDLLDFPKSKPLNRMIRHIFFGPLEDRAVPYVGGLIGGTMPGRDSDSPGYLYGGQVGVRFPVARGFSIDLGLQYTRFEINFQSRSDLSEQWLFTTGVRF